MIEMMIGIGLCVLCCLISAVIGVMKYQAMSAPMPPKDPETQRLLQDALDKLPDTVNMSIPEATALVKKTLPEWDPKPWEHAKGYSSKDVPAKKTMFLEYDARKRVVDFSPAANNQLLM